MRNLLTGVALALCATSPAWAEDGFATRSVTGLGLTGEPSQAAPDSAAGSRVGTGGNAGVVGAGSGSGAVGTGTGPGNPIPGGGTFGRPSAGGR